MPEHSPVGELVCPFLSVLYGKRFDHHGIIEGSGLYRTPDLSHYNSICNHNLPFNSHKQRTDFSIPLNITHFSALDRIFTGSDIDGIFSGGDGACREDKDGFMRGE